MNESQFPYIRFITVQAWEKLQLSMKSSSLIFGLDAETISSHRFHSLLPAQLILAMAK